MSPVEHGFVAELDAAGPALCWTGTMTGGHQDRGVAFTGFAEAFPKRWLGRFFAALQFLTRIRVPSWTPYGAEDLAKSSAFFPLVGLIVAACGFAGTWLAVFVLGFSTMIGALACTAIAVGVTGFFHEDALADVCDAFGGYTPERRREIMRDSRIGSFGGTGLALVLFAEVYSVSIVSAQSMWRVATTLVAAHMLARWSSVLLIARGSYVNDAASLTKPFARASGVGPVAFATATTAIGAVLAFSWWALGLGVGVVVLVWLANRFFCRWLGGLTGDAIGATNKVIQVAVLVVATHPRCPLPLVG